VSTSEATSPKEQGSAKKKTNKSLKAQPEGKQHDNVAVCII